MNCWNKIQKPPIGNYNNRCLCTNPWLLPRQYAKRKTVSAHDQLFFNQKERKKGNSILIYIIIYLFIFCIRENCKKVFCLYIIEVKMHCIDKWEILFTIYFWYFMYFSIIIFVCIIKCILFYIFNKMWVKIFPYFDYNQ